MLEVVIINMLGLLMKDPLTEPVPEVAAAEVSAAPQVSATVVSASPFPGFSAALGDCLDYVTTGDLAVFEGNTEISNAGIATSVMYPSMADMEFQLAASQQGDTRTCGGAGNGAPKMTRFDEDMGPIVLPMFAAHDLVEVAFPEPSRVWANCETGGDMFVMIVSAANDFPVLSVTGPEPVARTYCDVFGVK